VYKRQADELLDRGVHLIFESVENLLKGAAIADIVPLLRIDKDNPYLVRKALEAGAGGVIVPHVNTADEAREIVEAAKFPPKGKRGYGGLCFSGQWGANAGVDWMEWGKEMFASGARLADIDPDDAVSGDFKTYESGDLRFGIGQVEVQTLSDLDEVIPPLNEALLRVKESQVLDGTMLLITDVMREDSVLLIKGLDDAAAALPYERLADGVLSLPGILSRKKQLLPEIIRAVDETKTPGT
jgi:hypothetical protein